MSELVHPDDLAAVDPNETFDDETAAKIEATVAKVRDSLLDVEPFAPNDYRWDIRSAVDDLVANAGKRKVESAMTPVSGNIMDFVDAAIAKKKTVRKPRKTTTKKKVSA